MRNNQLILLITTILSTTMLAGCPQGDCAPSGAPPTTIQISDDETVTYEVLNSNGETQNIDISKTDKTIKIKRLDDTELLMRYMTSGCSLPGFRVADGKQLTRLERFLVKEERYSQVELVEVITNNPVALTVSSKQEIIENNPNVLGHTFDKMVTHKRVISDGNTEYIYETKRIQDTNKPLPNNGVIYAKITNQTTNTTEIIISLIQWNGK